MLNTFKAGQTCCQRHVVNNNNNIQYIFVSELCVLIREEKLHISFYFDNLRLTVLTNNDSEYM